MASVLWLALHLPRLPLEVFQRGLGQDTITESAAANDPSLLPLVVTAAPSVPRVLLPDAPAHRCGIQPGMTLSAAYALAPDLVARPRDLALETAALESLALWAEQFTPAVSLAPPDALLLEIGGCLRLFDGLEALLARVRQGLAQLGFDVSLASAPTPTGALMLARNGLELHVTDFVALSRRLGQLPAGSLETSAAITESLQRLGLRTLDDCLRLPRDGFARRFGQELVDQLDRALGRLPDPRVPHVPPARFASRLVLPVPVPNTDQILFGARRLATELAGFLTGRGAGATQLLFLLEHEAPPVTRIVLELSMPNRDAAHFMVLLRERLARLELPGPVEAFSLHCTQTMQLAPRNFSLFATRETATEHRAELVERLRARLGRQAVQGLVLVPEHRPELAFREAEPGSAAPVPCDALRPFWLLATPRPIAAGGLEFLAGPERIESGWWDGNDVRRDYYVAAQQDGSRVWVYCHRDGTGEPERWFVHGLFG
ncbi:MAG: DNA polymerase Y family protein [Betaproteobacteria bacterium]|nr:DNA polymerase Y family protein [Betaproteobacteria bacterium]